MWLKCLYGYVYLPYWNTKWCYKQQECYAEYIHCCCIKSYLNQKHCDYAQEQTWYAEYLHAPCQVKPATQIVYLCCCHFRVFLYILFFKSSYKLCVRQKSVRICQKYEWYCREQQCRSAQVQFFHIIFVFILFSSTQS